MDENTERFHWQNILRDLRQNKKDMAECNYASPSTVSVLCRSHPIIFNNLDRLLTDMQEAGHIKREKAEDYLEDTVFITEKGLEWLKQNNIPNNQGNSAGIDHTTFNIGEMKGNINQGQKGGTMTGPISATNVAVGEGASINIDARTFIQQAIEAVEASEATPEEKEEAKGILGRIAEHPLTSAAVGAALGAIPGLFK